MADIEINLGLSDNKLIAYYDRADRIELQSAFRSTSMKITAQPTDSNLLKSAADVIAFLLYAFVVIARSIYGFFLPRSYHHRKDITGR
ncbi:hypothetical protein NQ318_004226 [Aromia moschata]|uniref:Uncharacterized protein n=1 Tax=Aromia moschata TaxID=1265417 RepID=A0AAV8Y699_9CUCU|nr:hypothetical protein NQ318_004226 [Aromia moschata]